MPYIRNKDVFEALRLVGKPANFDEIFDWMPDNVEAVELSAKLDRMVALGRITAIMPDGPRDRKTFSL